MNDRRAPRTLRLLAALALAAVTALALAACGDDDDDDRDATATPPVTASATAPPTPSPSPAATATVAPPFGGTRGPVTSEGDAAGIVMLVAVRAARQDGFDRAVWEFEGGIPPYTVEYVEPPITADGSGMEVEIAGEAYLKVTFRGANAHTEAGQPTIGAREIPLDLPQVVELEQTGDFEAVVTWVIGLRGEADLTVTELDGPSRVVVDIAHP